MAERDKDRLDRYLTSRREELPVFIQQLVFISEKKKTETLLSGIT